MNKGPDNTGNEDTPDPTQVTGASMDHDADTADEWGDDDTKTMSDIDDTENDEKNDEKSAVSAAAHAMGLGGLSETLDEADKVMKDADDELENFDYEDDPLTEGDEDDPWNDDSVMEEGEDKGLHDCPFGQKWDEDEEKCVEIEGGYDNDDFNYDDNLDEFEEE